MRLYRRAKKSSKRDYNFAARQKTGKTTTRGSIGKRWGIKRVNTSQATHKQDPTIPPPPLKYLNAAQATQMTCHGARIAQQSCPANGRH